MRVDTVAVFKLMDENTQADLYAGNLNIENVTNVTGKTPYWQRNQYRILTEEEKMEKAAISLLTYQKNYQSDVQTFSVQFFAEGFKILPSQDTRCSPNYICKILNCNLKEGYD